MAINFIKYVDITSGVAGSATVDRRDLILRLFTTNVLAPTSTVVEFTSADEVGEFFGTSSEEYKRASFYFGFVSKSIRSPRKISFYRYVDTDVAPTVFGGKSDKSLSSFDTVSDASFDLEIGGVTHTITADLTTASSLTDVATLIKTQINAEAEAQFSGASLVYNATRKSFDLVGGVAENATISVTAGSSGTDISDFIEFNASATLSDGKLEQTIAETLNNSVDISSNFATFIFQDTLTITQKEEVGAWTKLQNIRYLFITTTSYADAQAHYDAIKDLGGVDVILESSVADEYHDLMPACIAAATDYSKVNSVQNYMFYQFSLTPSVTSNTVSNTLDALRINYYGQTQTAGQNISFYQRGNLMGLPVDPQAENIFINEAWLKDSSAAAIFELLLNVQSLGWNNKGRGLILNTLQGVIDLALLNGVMSTEKPLSSTQKNTISLLTGDENSWRGVQSQGFWVNAYLETEVVNGVTEYIADYLIVYSKGDAIRKVTGRHALI